MDWLSKTENWILIALLTVECHDLELRKMTFKIVSFTGMCVMVGEQRYE